MKIVQLDTVQCDGNCMLWIMEVWFLALKIHYSLILNLAS